jgi:hypothetical protein
MKNFKQIALGLVVGAMAISFSAFKTAEKFSAVTYYQLTQDNYTKLSNPSGNCDPLQTKPHACTITYATDPGVSSFTYSTRPAGGSESSTKEIWAE